MKTSKYILFALFTIAISSCKKLLDVQPEQQVDESRAITNLATATTAVNGMYNRLGADNYYGSNYPALSYLSGGDIQWSGSQVAPQEITLHRLSADNGNVGSAWSSIYTAILSANYVIDRVPQIEIPQVTKNQFLGEAYFIRALAYFDLVRGWGGVPIILKPTLTASDNVNTPRSTEAQTYAQVLADLTAAEPLLPETTVRNKATRKTVWALRARYHLYRQEWAQAEEYATKIISDNNYRLVTPFNAFFANNAVGTTEAVFELNYSVSFTNGHRNWWAPPALGGRREWSPNDALVTLLNNPQVGGTRSTLIARTSPPGNLWYGQLYYRNPAGTDPAYVIRIAELYFIRAEARAQLNNLTGSLSDLNAVRTRAGLVASTAATQADLILAIENERRLEFAFETDRWFDLKRKGRLVSVLGINQNQTLFPIPRAELNVNKAVTQNPGY